MGRCGRVWRRALSTADEKASVESSSNFLDLRQATLFSSLGMALLPLVQRAESLLSFSRRRNHTSVNSSSKKSPTQSLPHNCACVAAPNAALPFRTPRCVFTVSLSFPRTDPPSAGTEEGSSRVSPSWACVASAVLSVVVSGCPFRTVDGLGIDAFGSKKGSSSLQRGFRRFGPKL
jgi:hypothetical protein